MRIIIGLIFLAFSNIGYSFSAQAQSTEIYDYTKLTCIDYYEIYDKTLRDWANQATNKLAAANSDNILEYGKAIVILYWLMGHLSPSEKEVRLVKIAMVAKLTAEKCEEYDEKGYDPLLSKAMEEAIKQYDQKFQKSEKITDFYPLSCEQLLNKSQTKLGKESAILYISWLDGFLTEKAQLDFARLKNTTSQVFYKCMMRYEKNILSLVKEIGQPLVLDVASFRCEDYLRALSMLVIPKHRTQNIQRSWFEINLQYTLFAWFDGYLASSWEYNSKERIDENWKETNRTCVKNFNAPFFKVVSNIFQASSLLNKTPFSFIQETCGSFMVGLNEKQAELIWIAWIDGFFSKKDKSLSIARLEKLTDDLLKECPKQPDRNLVSLIEELRMHKQ